MSLPAALKSRLRLPLIAAPMFLVSGPALVKAACRAGVIGSFPTANCRTVEELDRWLADIGDDLKRAADETGRAPAPLCPNLIVHRSNPRVADDLAAVLRHGAEMVITQRRLARAGAEALEGRRLPGAGRRGLGASCREGRRRRRRRAGAADGGRGRPDRLGQSLRLRARGAPVLGRHRGDGGRHGRRPRGGGGRGAGLRSRLHGHQVHRHAREPGQGCLQGDAGRRAGSTTCC